MNEDHNPVWEVYDLYRTSRLNVKYYAALLHRTEFRNSILEFILACSAPTSAVAGLWFWDSDIGKEIWKYFGIIAALAAVTKPLLTLPKKIKEYESMLSGYRTLEHDLDEIRSSIIQKQKYDQTEKTEFKKAMKRKGVLVGKDPDAKEHRRIKKQCESEVLSELPINSFFIPKEQ
jgi:hypothetical protein